MKFKNYIETESGIKDTSTSPGTAGQVLSSTVTGTDWIDQGEIIAAAATLVTIECKNRDVITLVKGTPVYQTGTVGATDVIEVAGGSALISDGAQPSIGLLQQDLDVNEIGYVVITGGLLNITTDPIDGLTPVTGQKVFVKSGGGLTLTKPTTELNTIQNMGLIGKVSGGNAGSITVSSIMRTNDVPNLPEGRIWIGDGNTIVSNTVYVDEPNGRVGIGTDDPATPLHVYGTIDGEPTTMLVENGDTTITLGQLVANLEFRANDASVNGVGVMGQLAMVAENAGSVYGMGLYTKDGTPGVNEVMRLSGDGNVGIGETNPTQKLHVDGNARLTGLFYDGTNSGGTNGQILSSDGGQTEWIDGSAIPGVPAGSGTTNYLARWTPDANTLGIGVTYDNGTSVGIGTTSPGTYKLAVAGSTNIGGDVEVSDGLGGDKVLTLNANIGHFSIGDIDGLGDQAFISGDSSSISISTNQITTLHCDSNNRVGIGTIIPDYKLEVNGTIGVNRTDGIIFAGSVGPGFGNKITSDTQNNFIFSTSLPGSPYTISPRVTILNNGDVGIGTAISSTPAYGYPNVGAGRLVVGGSNFEGAEQPSVITLINQDTTINPGQDLGVLQFVGKDDLSLSGYCSSQIIGSVFGSPSSGDSGGGILRFLTNPGGTGNPNTEKMRILPSGNVGIGTTNPLAKLQVDGSANIGLLHTNFAGASFNVNLGFENYNNGFAAIATGQNTLADASQSFSMGFQSKATGSASLAGGNVNIIGSIPSESAGEASIAFGNGVKTNSNANYSQAFGRGTETGGGLTSANQAMAMGFGSIAFGDNSFSGGNNSRAFGEASFAFGEGASASKGDGNIALGIGVTTPNDGTNAYSSGQIAVGNYNVWGTGQPLSFSVGNGVSDSQRLTALCVNKNTGNTGMGNVFNPQSKLQVNGGIQLANDVAAASAAKVGTFRYYTSGNNSYVDMCMQTGASTYAWVNIVTNSW